ncbi:unnamed protein product [Camellia sinensis]
MNIYLSLKPSALFGDSFSLIFFGLCMAQTSTFFIKQSNTMNRNIGNNFVIPPASIHTLSAIGMIICVTAYEKIMSVFWLAPQFIILGIGDGFTLVGLQEYFYDQNKDTTEKSRSWTKEILVYQQTSTDTASNDDGDNDKYDTSRENGDSSAKVEEEPKCHEVAHNSGHSSNKESNGAMVNRESEVVVVAQA